MGRAQQRDAARSSKFYFRKDVLPPGHISPTSSVASSSGESSPTDCSDCGGGLRRKETKMRNCFPPLPQPENGTHRGPVEDEYEEMTMEEIMNGKVRIFLLEFNSFRLITLDRGTRFQVFLVSLMHIWIRWRSIKIIDRRLISI